MFGLSLLLNQCFIFFLGSDDTETEEDEVEKPPRKKKRGRKKAPKETKVKKATQITEVGSFSVMTYDYIN